MDNQRLLVWAFFGFMLFLIFSGAHIAVVLIMLSLLGIWLIRDNPKVAMRSLALAADGAINRYLFGVVPLFVLMGLIVDAADIPTLALFLDRGFALLEAMPHAAAEMPEVSRLLDISGQLSEHQDELADGLVRLAQMLEDIERGEDD